MHLVRIQARYNLKHSVGTISCFASSGHSRDAAQFKLSGELSHQGKEQNAVLFSALDFPGSQAVDINTVGGARVAAVKAHTCFMLLIVRGNQHNSCSQPSTASITDQKPCTSLPSRITFPMGL